MRFISKRYLWIAIPLMTAVAVALGYAIYASGLYLDDVKTVAKLQTPVPTPSVPNPPTYKPLPELEPEPEPETQVIDETWIGKVPSRLTGLPIPEEDQWRRPAAVVVNNLYRALPQSGLSQADVIHEVLAEANITRLVVVFQHYDTAKIGPIRSARDYFIDLALDFDAVFVHHGGSPAGYAKINNKKINHLDGMALEGKYYWRDRTYPDWYTHNSGTRPMEHSSYSSSEEIKAAITSYGYRDTWYEDSAPGFSFVDGGPPEVAGHPANVVRVPFSNEYTRAFAYDAETGLYQVGNKTGPHYDAVTGEQLAVSNIIIRSVSMRVVPGDTEGRREVQTVGEGGGWLATGGGYIAIKWKKSALESPVRYYFADGREMTLRPGRTWICVLQNDAEPIFEQSGKTLDE